MTKKFNIDEIDEDLPTVEEIMEPDSDQKKEK